MPKVFLSLDDLHKLYGLSPAVVSAIKSKRRKRRNKKAKINNGTMGNKPSPSEHMAGYASATAVAAGQLQQSSINKHIAEINKGNEKLRLTNDTTIKQPQIVQPSIKPEYQEMIDGIELGKFQVKQKGNAISIINKELDKKRGPKPGHPQVEDVGKASSNLRELLSSSPKKTKIKISSNYDNVGATSQPPGFINQPVSSQSLSNNGSNKFDRYETPAVSFDDGAGNIAAGTSSDNFIIDAATDLLNEVVNEGANEVAADANNEINNESANVAPDATDAATVKGDAFSFGIPQVADNEINNDSSNIAPEPNTSSNESNEPKVKTPDDYTSKELKELLSINGYKLTGLKTKEQMFKKLKDNNLL